MCSISVLSMASKSLLVTAGNMARDHEMHITFLGMHAAAAGLALQERRWFHISKARASRCCSALLSCPLGIRLHANHALSRWVHAVKRAGTMPVTSR